MQNRETSKFMTHLFSTLSNIKFKYVKSIEYTQHKIFVRFMTENAYYNNIFGFRIECVYRDYTWMQIPDREKYYVKITLIDNDFNPIYYDNCKFGYVWKNNLDHNPISHFVYGIDDDTRHELIGHISTFSKFFRHSRAIVTNRRQYAMFSYFKNHIGVCVDHESKCINNGTYSNFGGSVCKICKYDSCVNMKPHVGNYWTLHEKNSEVKSFSKITCAIKYITEFGNTDNVYLLKKFNYGTVVHRILPKSYPNETTCYFEKFIFDQSSMCWKSSHIRTDDEINEITQK